VYTALYMMFIKEEMISKNIGLFFIVGKAEPSILNTEMLFLKVALNVVSSRKI
jgi:hypothetical protein